MDFLAKWQPFEGGHTNNNARFNYLNTTQRMPGSHDINSVGVQSYGSLGQGAQAFAKTLLGRSQYAPLVNFLKTGQGDPTPGLEEWVSGSQTGNPGYAAKVMGNHPAPVSEVTSPVSDLTLPAGNSIPLTQPNSVNDIQTQARHNLAAIAGGARATDTIGSLAGLMKTLHQTQVRVAIPTGVGPTSMGNQGSDLDTQAANLVHKYLGVKYTWGGTSAATGFDCSGLVQTVWKQLGIKVPRTSQEQFTAGKPVAKLQPGDAVFFVGSDGTADAPGHEGLYIGNGKYIAAPHTGAVVSVFNLADAKDYVGARRFA
jgi:cell wall-associated NlpC family hydrolase